ncbi:hypothetical protein AEP_04112 (plasmid) [Curvibacter sp. AEP1-3]|uniref:hypothetical protein n=1 Tax=Curvibacter sp. AEP1-3 TaxID=1844971 RepID=UPI000B3CB0DE|nr:hypothetical protein [Curvibacter sp. AEP1-3]ARV21026.1 hypothetical protein AEP_04112 [Curvibacter sp. AEP1-3]
MKKTILMACIGAVVALSLAGCNDKESELDKTIKEGTETSQKMAGKDRPIPRIVIAPDNTPQPKKDGGK